jgi:hypothetical protein
MRLVERVPQPSQIDIDERATETMGTRNVNVRECSTTGKNLAASGGRRE